MKRFFFLAVLLLTLSQGCKKKDKVEGDCALATLTRYRGTSTTPEYIQQFQFNPDGTLLNFASGQYLAQYSYSGSQIKITTSFNDLVTLDLQGGKVVKSLFNTNEAAYTYAADGTLSLIKKLGPMGNVSSSLTLNYANGNLIKAVLRDANNAVYSTYEWEYGAELSNPNMWFVSEGLNTLVGMGVYAPLKYFGSLSKNLATKFTLSFTPDVNGRANRNEQTYAYTKDSNGNIVEISGQYYTNEYTNGVLTYSGTKFNETYKLTYTCK
ncbi:MAG: hypothetical protein REI78_08490 [Pedobacter sp.]|nr:hypothetical protein [Pedobacter sp.]MDQ8053052.1 hypothetical protein [Pedobacter sp.]